MFLAYLVSSKEQVKFSRLSIHWQARNKECSNLFVEEEEIEKEEEEGRKIRSVNECTTFAALLDTCCSCVHVFMYVPMKRSDAGRM